MIKITLIKYIQNKIDILLKQEYSLENQNFIVEKNKDINNGEIYSNIAMVTAKKIGLNPMDNATNLAEKLQKMCDPIFEKIVVVKPGYLNFYLSKAFISKYMNYILFQGNQYGQFLSKNLMYNIEFVSANPTGYLHIGHARNAALGMTLANVWNKYGIEVEKEYYINDAGNQINILGISTFLRYLELFGINVNMDGDYYKANEIILIAQEIKNLYGNKYVNAKYTPTKIENKEIFNFFKEFALSKMLVFIKEDLNSLSIHFDRFSSEKEMYHDNSINEALDTLKDYIYQQDGATWLKTTSFGDDKDRVLIKSNGEYTYFMPDIAYHFKKITRNPKVKKIFNIWGADHKSYVDRMTIALQCLGFPKDIMHVIIMQMVRLTKNGEEFKMSKRSGNSLTLKDLLNAIGKDSSRWALVSQTAGTQIEIDVDKFISQTHDNNLYYVLYAYARICQILNKTNLIDDLDENFKLENLNNIKEKELISNLIYFPCTIENIANSYEANKLVNYLYGLAQIFHSYYNEVKIIDDSLDETIIKERLILLMAIKNTINSGLKILNIQPKQKL